MKIEQLNDKLVDATYKGVGDILTYEQKRRGMIILALQHIQCEYNYLPEDVLKQLSKNLRIPLADIYSIASFYKQFYFTPRGKNVVCVCMGTACYIRGGPKILEKLKETFQINEGETTADLSVSLETVGCVGVCARAPVLTINNEIIGSVGPKKVEEIIKTTRQTDRGSYGKT